MAFLYNDWQDYLKEEFEKPYYLNLRDFLKEAYTRERIFPPAKEIYQALHLTSYEETKVVILGQDPYHGEGQAHGLAFSVREGMRFPPSLVNIFKELEADLGCPYPSSGDLTPWAKEGVLLLNTTLTVKEKTPLSHKDKGWETLTDSIIKVLAQKESPLVFILWGANARAKKAYLKDTPHLIIESAHPSPLSAHRGFFGSKPFSKCNAFLKSVGQEEIDWCLL
jgi:uracil-DNA glycosylase